MIRFVMPRERRTVVWGEEDMELEQRVNEDFEKCTAKGHKMNFIKIMIHLNAQMCHLNHLYVPGNALSAILHSNTGQE